MRVTSEDGHEFGQGDLVYDYYDMVPGVIADEPRDDGWFTFREDVTNRVHILNGQRICSMEFAFAKGWPGAKLPN